MAGKQFRRSAKTRDVGAAKLMALKWFKEMERKLESGESIEVISFGRLKRSYLDLIRGQNKYNYHAKTIERHFLPFFAQFDDVSKLKKSHFLDYMKFRVAKGEAAPTPQTMNRENTVLRQMLRYAVDMGWLKAAPKIDMMSERLSARRRRHFTFQEYKTLYRTARRRARAAGLNGHHSELRQLLLDYIVLLVNTGMRVDESKTLIWRNVDWESKSLLLEHAGKVRSTRRVLMRQGAVLALKRIHQRRESWLVKNGGEFSQNDKVIALPNGKTVTSFKKGFDQLLAACGFVYGSVEEKHALTSLRHTYATFRLTTRTGKRASVRALAKQMGTSEKMIERHYGHDVVEDYREELAG
jgi:integrase